MDAEMIVKYQALKQESLQLKMKLAEIFATCQELIKGVPDRRVTAYHHCISDSGDSTKFHPHLRDVLESNQQHQVYDEQREEHIERLRVMIYQLEHQLEQANNALQDKEVRASLEVMQPWEIQQGGSTVQENKVKDLEQLKQWWIKMQLEAALAENKMRTELHVEQRRCWEKQLSSLRSKLNITISQLIEQQLKCSELQGQVDHWKSLLNEDMQENSTEAGSTGGGSVSAQGSQFKTKSYSTQTPHMKSKKHDKYQPLDAFSKTRCGLRFRRRAAVVYPSTSGTTASYSLAGPEESPEEEKTKGNQPSDAPLLERPLTDYLSTLLSYL